MRSVLSSGIKPITIRPWYRRMQPSKLQECGLVQKREQRLPVANKRSRMRKRTRYIRSLFRFRDSTARITLFRSLVLPLFEYCCPVIRPAEKTPQDALENEVVRFVKTLSLRAPRNDHRGRLEELGWNCLTLERLRKSLELVYKMVFQLMPYVDRLFVPYESDISACFVAGNTRSQQHLSLHLYPLKTSGSTLSGLWVPASDCSFAHHMAKLWNDILLPEAAYRTLTSFRKALDELNWNAIPWITSHCDDAHRAWF